MRRRRRQHGRHGERLDIAVIQNPANFGLTNPANPRADVNCDGVVSGLDIALLQLRFGLITGPCCPPAHCPGPPVFDDCDSNGLPDECDISGGTSTDCNTNGIPDVCELGAGSAVDCNADGVPDECDIASGTTTDCPAPAAGADRPWETAIPVSAYSSANLATGNLFTVIPLVAWGGRGPALAVNLYHSSAGVTSNGFNGSGYDFGPGWSISYSARIDATSQAPDVVVIHDDGMRDVFVSTAACAYEPPPGVFETLECVTGGGWRLRYKSQAYREFDANGLLEKEVDSTSNALSIVRYPDGRIDYVQDASCRRVAFAPDGTEPTQLSALRASQGPNSIWSRQWELGYTTLGGGWTISSSYDARDKARSMQYDAVGRVTQFSDRDGHAWTYAYGACGAVTQVNDPFPLQSQSQRFEFVRYESGKSLAIYTDRRAIDWRFEFDTSGAVTAAVDPLGARETLIRDCDHNVTRSQTALGREWTYSYDDRGNMLSSSDPAGYATMYAYDAWNNLTQFTDANQHAWSFVYADPATHPLGDPTLLLEIHEPPDGLGNPAAVTLLEYYDTNGVSEPAECPLDTSPASRGALRSVTDPNGVVTWFNYDSWGQPAEELEGVEVAEPLRGGLRNSPDEQALIWGVSTPTPHSGNGFPTGGPSGDGFGGNGLLELDAEGRLDHTKCFPPDTLRVGGSTWAQFVPAAFPGLPHRDATEAASMAGGAYGHIPPQSISWTDEGRLGIVNVDVHYPPLSPSQRSTLYLYDSLGRPTYIDIESEDADAHQQITTLSYFDTAGAYRVVSAGQIIDVTLDLAGRTETVTNGTATAVYEYRLDGLVERVLYGDTPQMIETLYDYDPVNDRLERITHRIDGQLVERREYVYDAAGRILSIIETGVEPQPVTIVYQYDDRNRLVRETRTPSGAGGSYDIEYAYDQGGNRLSKSVVLNGGDPVTYEYHYDLEDTDRYGSRNNRLAWYEASWQTPQGPAGEKVWYYYNTRGNVRRIVSRRDGEDIYKSLRFEYDRSGRLWRAVADQWDDDGIDWQTVDDVSPAWQIGLSREDMSYADAQQFATTNGAALAWIANDPEELAWIIAQFRPALGAGGSPGPEVSAWLGVTNLHDAPGTCTPGVDCCDDTPWCCWTWDETEQYSLWVPQSPVCTPTTFCTAGGIEGGWLPDEPDDGGDCVEDGDEDRMVLVWNRDIDPGPGVVPADGLADVDTSGLRRALIRRPAESEPPGYQRRWAREFRYDEPRQRYLNRVLDPETLMPATDRLDEWTEYVGNAPATDYALTGPTLREGSGGADGDLETADSSGTIMSAGATGTVGATGAGPGSVSGTARGGLNLEQTRQYIHGVAEEDLSGGQVAGTNYVHGDHLGTTTLITDGDASPPVPVRRTIYTAFGEVIETAGSHVTRYGYAGSWGYQQHDIDSNGQGDGQPDSFVLASPTDGFAFMHLGHRYYDPALGRFLQRDPIGIRGGSNVYEYVTSNPLTAVDPSGFVLLQSKLENAAV